MPFTRNVVMNSQRDVVETILTVPKLERTCFDDKKTLLYQPDSEVVPAGAKLPLIPGSHLHLFTRELGQRVKTIFYVFHLNFSAALLRFLKTVIIDMIKRQSKTTVKKFETNIEFCQFYKFGQLIMIGTKYK